MTPAFDHRDPGTPEQRWRDSSLGEAVAVDGSGFDSLLVVAAHPDDETLGAGGLIHQLASAGRPVTVLIATDGERSHPDSPTHPPPVLAALRRIEVLAAVGDLAPDAQVELLGLPDGELAAHAAELDQHVAAHVTAGTLLVATWRGDGHPDHAAVGNVAAAVAARTGGTLWEYPIWAWHWADPLADSVFGDGLRRVRLTGAARAAKRSALARHVSQVRPLSDQPGDEAVLAPEFAAHFDRPYEVVLVTDPGEPLQRPYFEQVYAQSVDPWRFETRWYEERKRALTIAALPRRRFRSAFEPGCSIGMLTAELAGRCDRILATDITDEPLAAARSRLADRPGVTLQVLCIPDQFPDQSFDLIVLSEVGYYLSATGMHQLAGLAERALTADGVLIACHWRHPVTDYPLAGDTVHAILTAVTSLKSLAHYEDADFLLDVLVPQTSASVASQENLVSGAG